VTLAECCFDTGFGAEADVPVTDASADFGEIAALFGESASRAIVSLAPERTSELAALAQREDVPFAVIGRVGGARIRLSVRGRAAIDEPLDAAERVWSTAIDRLLEPARAIA
jgi:phosphoribosylformylglycinamidine synthase